MPGSVTLDDSRTKELLEEICRWPIFDPHSHIDPHRPAARNLDEILGYHYYTELAHSAGMPSALVDPSLDPLTRVQNLACHLHSIDNTVQYSWLIEILRTFYDAQPAQLHPSKIEALFERSQRTSQSAGQSWDQEVWDKTNLEAVFLTNDFDDPLTGWETDRFVPCLRTDDLVFKLHEPRTLERLKTFTNVDVNDLKSLRQAIGVLFEHFLAQGARACAISLTPDFVPTRIRGTVASTPIRRAVSGQDLRADEHQEIRATVFWTLAEFCAEFQLPFDLMIGPIRNIYPAGVSGGRDLFDRRVSLAVYHDLFNHFSSVTFPVSTLSPDAGPELVAFSWIFPNVVPMGHWWYSNIPEYIGHDLRARLQAVPKTKTVGYYSDAYKLEFVLPKFNMFRKVLAQTLAAQASADRSWSVDRCLELARLVLIENPKRIFSRKDDGPSRRA
jgi:glucuronate isomerase